MLLFSYGGILRYTFRYSGAGNLNQEADVIIRVSHFPSFSSVVILSLTLHFVLIQGNDITLQYTHRGQLRPDQDNTVEVQLFEDRWQRADGQVSH